MKKELFKELSNALRNIGLFLTQDQTLARLLYDTSRAPLDDSKPDVDWILDGTYKNYISYKPLTVVDDIQQSKINIIIPRGTVGANMSFSDIVVAIEVWCPPDLWEIESDMLRPHAIMDRIYNLCNGKRISGIGTLDFSQFILDTVDDNLTKHSMIFLVDVING